MNSKHILSHSDFFYETRLSNNMTWYYDKLYFAMKFVKLISESMQVNSTVINHLIPYF